METKIKELAKADALTSALILLGDARDLKRNLSIELQAVRDDRLDQARDFAELMGEIRQTLAEIKAQNRIDATLLNLVTPESGRLTDEKRRTGTNS